jgi:peptide/nickel transport system permease protein
MIRFVLHRLAQLVPVVLVASIGVWGMIYAVPGGPVAALVGENATPEQIGAVTKQLGLDRPVLAQYGSWLAGALSGDLGVSLQSRDKVSALIAERLPATVQLGVVAIVVGLLLGVPVAFASAMAPGSVLDRLLSGWSALALGVPTFWLGILLILMFAVELHWLPAVSAYVPIWQSPLAMVRNTVLPALSLGVYVSGIFARFLRSALLQERRADYVRTARSKGLTEAAIMRRHIMRNAMLPFVTVVGLMAASFIGGALVTESVFTYPGLGRLLVQAIAARDYPLIQGCILVVLLIYVVINLAVDMLYVYIDPRVDYG